MFVHAVQRRSFSSGKPSRHALSVWLVSGVQELPQESPRQAVSALRSPANATVEGQVRRPDRRGQRGRRQPDQPRARCAGRIFARGEHDDMRLRRANRRVDKSAAPRRPVVIDEERGAARADRAKGRSEEPRADRHEAVPARDPGEIQQCRCFSRALRSPQAQHLRLQRHRAVHFEELRRSRNRPALDADDPAVLERKPALQRHGRFAGVAILGAGNRDKARRRISVGGVSDAHGRAVLGRRQAAGPQKRRRTARRAARVLRRAARLGQAALPGFEAPRFANGAVVEQARERWLKQPLKPVAPRGPAQLIGRSASRRHRQHDVRSRRQIDDAPTGRFDEAIGHQRHWHRAHAWHMARACARSPPGCVPSEIARVVQQPLPRRTGRASEPRNFFG